MAEKKSVLDRYPQEILGYSLSVEQKIWIYFIAAIFFKSAVFMFDLASGIAVVNEHFSMGYPIWGTITLLLMYFPSFVFYIIIISRPELWDEKDGLLNAAEWFAYRTTQLLAYPIWVMYRYAKQFFWAVEALTQKDESEREAALHTANQPSQTELYLFLQAFLQAIPQAFFQIYIMLAHYQQDKTISQMQALCVTSSLMLVAEKTVSFLWFESQKKTGRIEPWSPRTPFIKQNVFNENKKPINEETFKIPEEAESSTPFLQPRGVQINEPDSLNDLVNEEDAKTSEQSAEYKDLISVPTYSAPPRPKSYSDLRTVIDLRDDVYFSPHISKSTPDITKQKTEHITDEVKSFPQKETVTDLPKRKVRFVGREHDDALGKTVAFLWWIFFLFSRLLAIATCAKLQPFVALGVFIVHYIIISYLLNQNGFPRSLHKVFIQICVAYILTFCCMEFRYRLKNAIVFYSGFFTLMALENAIMSVSWYAYSDFDGFWYKYVFIIIFASCLISFLSMALYLSILKPRQIVINK